MKHVGTITPVLSGLAHWSAASLPNMGPFPLYFDEHRTNYRCHADHGEKLGNGPASMRVAMADPFPVVRPWKECAIRFEDPRLRSPYKAPIRVSVSKTSVERSRAEARLQAAYRAAAPRIETKPIWLPPANKPIDFVTQFDMLMDDEISDKTSIASHKRAYSPEEKAIARRWQAAKYSSMKFDALELPGSDQSREERHKFDMWPYFTIPIGSNKYDLVMRPLTENEVEFGFAKGTTLVAVLAQNKLLKKVVDAKTSSGRAYQAASFLRKVYWNGPRRVDTFYLIAARYVVQTVSLALQGRDLDHHQQRLAVLANRWRRLSERARSTGCYLDHYEQCLALQLPPFHSLLDIVPLMLRPDVSSYDATVRLGLKDASNLRDRLNGALDQIEKKFGKYCNALPTPPQNVVRVVYTESIGSREIVELQLSPAERAERVADYLTKATRPALSPLSYDFIFWLRVMYRHAAGALIARYLERGAGIYRMYRCVADYLQHDGRILTTQAIHYGTAPLGKDGRSNRTILNEYLCAPAEERPKWTPNADTVIPNTAPTWA